MNLFSLTLLVSALAFGQATPHLHLNIPDPAAFGWGTLPGNFHAIGGYSERQVLDVSTLPSVDCTGATDSSTALNKAFDSRRGGDINGKHVVFPTSCRLKLTSQVVVFGQSNFVIDGGGRPGATIFGCNGSAGALLLVNRSGHGEIRGLGVQARGTGCTSNFTGSVLISNANTRAGVTTTDLKFVNMSLYPAGGGIVIPNYVGIQFAVLGEVNTEDMRIMDSAITCSNSPRSYGIDIEGNNSDDDEAYHNIITDCFQGVRIFAGGGRFTNNKFSGNGNYAQFGPGGSTFWVRNCAVPLDIIGNEAAEGAGQFINSNNDEGGFGCQMVILGNQWTLAGGGSIAPNVYPVNLNSGAADHQVVIGNSFNANGATAMPIIGSDRRSPNPPLGSLVELGNEVLHDTGGILRQTFAQGTISTSKFVDGTNSIQPLISLQTPSSSSATCTAGQMWADARFVYVCTGTNRIKRAALSAF